MSIPNCFLCFKYLVVSITLVFSMISDCVIIICRIENTCHPRHFVGKKCRIVSTCCPSIVSHLPVLSSVQYRLLALSYALPVNCQPFMAVCLYSVLSLYWLHPSCVLAVPLLCTTGNTPGVSAYLALCLESCQTVRVSACMPAAAADL